MLALQEELTSTENKVAFARQAFNDAVTTYNTAVEKFPNNLVAGIDRIRPGPALRDRIAQGARGAARGVLKREGDVPADRARGATPSRPDSEPTPAWISSSTRRPPAAQTGLLVVYFVAAVVLIVLLTYAVVAGVVCLLARAERGPGARRRGALWDPGLFAVVAAGTLALIGGGSLYRVASLAGGGQTVAEMLGGRPLLAQTTDPDERKILNVVEEMAIASGTPVPPVYLLEQEDGINAFAAGYTPGDAVIGVTRGCIRQPRRATSSRGSSPTSSATSSTATCG